MKFVKQAFVLYISSEMTTSVRFCLSYDPLKRDFISFKMNNISVRKCTADTDVISDITSTCPSVISYVVI